MKIRRFFGKDMREALSQVKAELGSDAVIMSNRKVADGMSLSQPTTKNLKRSCLRRKRLHKQLQKHLAKRQCLA